MRYTYISAEKSEGKRLLGRLKRRWECNINTELEKIGSCGLDSTGTNYGVGGSLL